MGSEKLDITMNQEEDDSLIAANYCRDHIRGFCARENCRYLHETPPKSCLKDLFRFCHDFQNKGCFRQNCKFVHADHEAQEHFYATGSFPRDPRNVPVCQAYLHNACTNQDCKYVHPPDLVGNNKVPGVNSLQQPVNWRTNLRDEDAPPEAKIRRIIYDDTIENALLSGNNCSNCNALEHKNQLLHENISILLKKIGSLNEKNDQLTTMNEFLLEQSASVRNEHSCVITSRHGTSAPVSLATVSMTPVVSLAGAIPALLPATATPNLTLAPASSGAQLLTPPQILTVSTTQQLMGNSGALIVTSAGAQQLMQVSDSGTLMGAPGQTVVAVTPAQLTIAPPAQQLMSGASQNAVQQLVQQSTLQPQLAHQNAQFAAQQSVQHLAARQSAQHLAQHSAQHLAAQQSAQHLAQQSAQHLAQQSAQHLAQQSAQHLAQQSAQHLAQQSAQHLAQQSAQHLAQQSAHLAAQQSAQLAAAQQSAQQQMVAQQSAQQQAAQQTAQQQLVQQTAQQQLVQQITISSTSQSMALPNSQAQTLTFPIISQSILPH